ncbi:MAG: efflux RND transporter periplasmic adaptor subunit [Paracoccaceae bacterium]|jgi:membrane fusion protein (multidrug efflux system)
MFKRFLIALLALILVAGGVVGYNLFRDKMIAQFFATMKPAPAAVSVTEAQPISWTPGLAAIGTAHARHGVDLSTEATGTVREILFSANAQIEKGQLLVQIDDRIERADLAAAEAALALAETSLKRVKELKERGVSAVSTLDETEAAAAEARASVAKLKAALETKQLVAPFAGTIGIPKIELGQFVSAGTAYATLQDRERMRVDFTLSEQEAGLVSIGQSLSVRAEAGAASLRGTVTGIDPKIDPNSRLVSLRAEVDNPEGLLTPGQFLQVWVDLPREDGVIALPQTVVASNLYGDSVYVIREETPEGAEAPELIARQVFVQLGRRSGELIEIRTGVQPGDKVVNAGQNKLSSGARVVIDNSVAPDAAAKTE